MNLPETPNKVSAILNEFDTFVIDCKNEENRKVLHFKGGRLSQFVYEWQTLTSDIEILNTMSGLELDFSCKPSQLCFPKQHQFSAEKELQLLIMKF